MKNIFLLFALMFLCSCAQNESGKVNATNKNQELINELGYNPQLRWPEKGSFEFQFFVPTCSTAHEFKSKANYCLALQDDNLNQSCALTERQATFAENCGNDFQEINIIPRFSMEGFDKRLLKSCRTGTPRTELFTTEKQLCQFLKDEELHEFCFWDTRLQFFKDLSCAGPFSPEPVSP